MEAIEEKGGFLSRQLSGEGRRAVLHHLGRGVRERVGCLVEVSVWSGGKSLLPEKKEDIRPFVAGEKRESRRCFLGKKAGDSAREGEKGRWRW